MINPADIIFTNRCPLCGEVIKLSERECPSCREKIPQSGVRKFGKYKCAYAFPYSGEYRKAVLEYKFHGVHSLSRPLAAYMKTAVECRLADGCFDVVTYVPMYREHRFGFNHSRTLAKRLARQLALPCEKLLVKTRKTKKQHSLSIDNRRYYVRGAFCAVSGLAGRNVLLVDDIVTTGYTLAECIRTLKAAGAGRICCVALCSVTQK